MIKRSYASKIRQWMSLNFHNILPFFPFVRTVVCSLECFYNFKVKSNFPALLKKNITVYFKALTEDMVGIQHRVYISFLISYSVSVLKINRGQLTTLLLPCCTKNNTRIKLLKYFSCTMCTII